MTFTTSSIGRSPSTSELSPAPSSAASPAATRSEKERGQERGRERGLGVRCLWVTMADPEPRHNGQYVYSGGLIDSVAAAGGDVEVLGLGRTDSPRANGAARATGERSKHVVWWLPDDSPHPRWGSLASTLP